MGSFQVFFRGGAGATRLLHLFQQGSQVITLFIEPHLAFQFLHPGFELVLLRVRYPLGPARGLVLQGVEQRLERSFLPLVKGLPGDAQLLGRLLGRDLARPDLQNEARSQLGGRHLRCFCRSLRGAGKLDLLQPLGYFPGGGRGLALEQERLQARAQGLPPSQIDPGLQCLEHALHRSLLPLSEGRPVDFQLPADFRGFAPLGPDPQDGLGFVLGRVAGLG